MIEFPLQLIAVVAGLPEGATRDPSGSADGRLPVIGAGDMLAFPVSCTPPTTRTWLAVMRAFPLAAIALEAQFELTCTGPETVIIALPVSDKDPQAVGFNTWTGRTAPIPAPVIVITITRLAVPSSDFTVRVSVTIWPAMRLSVAGLLLSNV